MPISKTVSADNGVTLSYHRAVQLAVDLAADVTTVVVNSHASEQAALDNLPVAWQWRVNIPVDRLAGDEPTVLGDVEAVLVGSEASPFVGGDRVPDRSDTVEAAKERAWNRTKVARIAAEARDIAYDGAAYQADRERISGAAQLAWMAKCAGQEYAITWTLADNTTRTLDADGMIGLGVALGRQITQAHDTGRALRDQIAAATTVEEADAIGWPA